MSFMKCIAIVAKNKYGFFNLKRWQFFLADDLNDSSQLDLNLAEFPAKTAGVS